MYNIKILFNPLENAPHTVVSENLFLKCAHNTISHFLTDKLNIRRKD